MIELSQEVESWYVGLALRDRAFADRAMDRLSVEGPRLGMPHSRSLVEGLRELRFGCESVARRITYVIDTERIITLTTFRKQRDNERREIQRAKQSKKRRGEST